MIYSEKFVWLHFPKCAGTKVEQLFRKYFSTQDRLVQDRVNAKLDPTIAWHDSIDDREARDRGFVLGERIVICSFRRLPSWLESRYNFEAERSPHLAHRPELLLEGKFLEARGVESHADVYSKKYLPDRILQSGKVRFLRTEYFESDFKRIFADFVDVSRIPDWEFKERLNSSKGCCLPARVRDQLYDGRGTVYDKCPHWRSIDEIAYGV